MVACDDQYLGAIMLRGIEDTVLLIEYNPFLSLRRPQWEPDSFGIESKTIGEPSSRMRTSRRNLLIS